MDDHLKTIVKRLQFEIAMRAVVKRSSKWPAARRAHLAKFPTCAATGTKDCVEVHHKLPFHLHPELELDPANLITLTERDSFNAHFWIGHAGNWRTYNPYVVEDAAQMLKRIKERLVS